MEVFFLDVGQGTAQVILTGNRRAIVIDCGGRENGRTGRGVLHFLLKMGVEYIEHLAISHSHFDHLGGAISLLNHFSDQIGKIWVVADHLFTSTQFAKQLKQLLREGKLQTGQVDRLECSEHPKLVWENKQRGVKLLVYSPLTAENLLAQMDQTPNPTSAILFLENRNQRIAFAADSEIEQWREVCKRSGRRLKCAIFAVPHHGGKVHATEHQLDWLFGQAVEIESAIVSTGTSNQHGHPRPDVIAALRRHGATVLCTQITSRCHAHLEALRPGVLQPIHLGQSSPRQELTGSGASKNVACAGTVRASVSDTGFEVDRLSQHQRAVDQLPRTSHSCPLCRSR